MTYKDFNALFSKNTSNGLNKTFAVVAAEDSHTLEAILQVHEEGIARPILIGNADRIREIIDGMGKGIDGLEILDEAGGPEACAQKAADLVNAGGVDFISKGLVDTAVVLKAALRKENNLLTGGLVSTVAFMEIPTYHKLVCATDCGMNIYPNLSQKKDILVNAVETCRSLGIENPKVAVLCPVEHIEPKIQETVDAQELKQMNISGEIRDCMIEGPISYDIAMSKEAAEIKGFSSLVAGDPDILLMPNLSAGNISMKALMYSGKTKVAGMAVGLKVPLVITSRSAPAEEKYLSILLAAACSKPGEKDDSEPTVINTCRGPIRINKKHKQAPYQEEK